MVERVKGSRRRRIHRLLAERWVDPASEAGRVVLRWLAQEPADASAAPAARLAAAVDCALATYWGFTKAFAAFFLEPDCRGPACVRRALRRHFGFVDARMTEAVLNRICDRRLHLLDGFFRKYQQSLFVPSVLDPARLRGYLVRVAAVESRHVPADDLPRKAGPIPDAATLEDPRREPEEAGPDLVRWGARLAAFWGPGSGFTADQRLEGLVSLGLGFLTGVPEVAARCRALLRQKLPAWEEGRDRLRRLSSRLLAKGERLKQQADAATDPGERQRLAGELARLDERLARLDERSARHLARLRPRPREVKRLLAGFVVNASNVRFRRIRREIGLLERRVTEGVRELRQSFPAGLPGAVGRLAADATEHLAARPSSPSAHGLTPAERERRLRLNTAWLTRAKALLGRTRPLLGALAAGPAPDGPRWLLLGFLADLHDLYELGLLTPRGVVRGLGRRHGWRLDRLLRR